MSQREIEKIKNWVSEAEHHRIDMVGKFYEYNHNPDPQTESDYLDMADKIYYKKIVSILKYGADRGLTEETVRAIFRGMK